MDSSTTQYQVGYRLRNHIRTAVGFESISRTIYSIDSKYGQYSYYAAKGYRFREHRTAVAFEITHS